MTPEEIDLMAELWAEGDSVKRIAEKMGYAPSTIRSFACDHRDRFPFRRSPVDNEKMDLWLERIASGRARPSDVVNAMGVSRATVWLRMKARRNRNG